MVTKKGKIKKVTGDFGVRQGVTQEPLADVDFFGESSSYDQHKKFLT